MLGRVSEKESTTEIAWLWVCGHGVSLGRGMHPNYMVHDTYLLCRGARTRPEEMILE